MNIIKFLKGSIKNTLKGSLVYYLWMAFLCALILVGFIAYLKQFNQGLITTNMRDSISWAFYIGNFTFLVGIAAAAVILVIPAYIYNWKPIKEVVLLGELLAICAIIMCILFVIVDVGKPLRVWHMMPFIGNLNLPSSLLAWDFLVLTLYLIVNITIAGYLTYKGFMKEKYNQKFITPLILFSIPLAISIHTVTAFLYNGFAAKPYWNTAILAPRFLCSAFCSGPAILLILFQILKRTSKLEIKNEAIWKIAELMAYAACINLFLFGAEIFKEYYTNTHHVIHYKYLFSGINGKKEIVPFAWISFLFNLIAFFIFLIPITRKNFFTLNIGCIIIYIGVYIEKGVAFIVPGYTPDALGEIYVYTPSLNEVLVTAGIFGMGFFLFTIFVRIAIPISLGTFNIDTVD